MTKTAKKTAKLTSADALLGLVAFGERATADLDRVLRPLGLTLRQWMALGVLEQGARHQRDLARALGRNDSNITALVDHLAHQGLVQRDADDADRRRSVVSLTQAGRERRRAGERLVGDVARRRVPRGQLHAAASLLERGDGVGGLDMVDGSAEGEVADAG